MTENLLHGFGWTVFLSVLPILNPFGAMTIFPALTAGQSLEYQQRMALRASIYVVVIMVIALLAGRAVLAFFGVSVGDLQVDRRADRRADRVAHVDRRGAHPSGHGGDRADRA